MNTQLLQKTTNRIDIFWLSTSTLKDSIEVVNMLRSAKRNGAKVKGGSGLFGQGSPYWLFGRNWKAVSITGTPEVLAFVGERLTQLGEGDRYAEWHYVDEKGYRIS